MYAASGAGRQNLRNNSVMNKEHSEDSTFVSA
jgi:hypothetical protein